jgi:hyaluronate lyase
LYGKAYYDNPGHPLNFTSSSESQNKYVYFPRGTAVGYLFLDAPPVSVTLERVTRSRRVVRTANPDTPVTRSVFGVTVHGAAGARPARLAYALVPNATDDWLRAHRHGRIEVLANSPRLQAVTHSGLGLTAANSFAPGRHEAAGLRVDGPASVIVRRRGRGGGTTTVAVSDPTMDRDRITVLLRGRRLRKVTADDGVRVSRDPGGTRIDVDTHHAYGRSFTVTLRG